MPKPTVFVLGCSGLIGSATVKALSEKYTDRVNILAGTRDPASEKVAMLKNIPGVTVLRADMNDKEALRDLLRGVISLFIVTPTDGFKLAIGAAEVAKSSGVKHILTVSVLTVELADTIYGKQYGELESSVRHLEMPYTFIRLPPFVENYWAYKQPIQQKSSFSTPGDPTKPFSAVVVADAGKAAAAIMAEPERHYGKTYKLISNCHTLGELAATFSEVLGKEVKYERISYEACRNRLINVVGFCEEDADGILEIYRLTDEECPLVNDQDTSHFTKITGEKPTTLKEWVSEVAPAFK
ncbi:nmrA-like family domain-containing protein 1 [Oculina patagonica]